MRPDGIVSQPIIVQSLPPSAWVGWSIASQKLAIRAFGSREGFQASGETAAQAPLRLERCCLLCRRMLAGEKSPPKHHSVPRGRLSPRTISINASFRSIDEGYRGRKKGIGASLNAMIKTAGARARMERSWYPRLTLPARRRALRGSLTWRVYPEDRGARKLTLSSARDQFALMMMG